MSKKICSVEGCSNNLVAKGYCYKHYSRFRKHGDVNYNRLLINSGKQCKVENCCSQAKSRGYCGIHYKRLWLYGDPNHFKKLPRGVKKQFVFEFALEYRGDDCLIWPYKNSKGYASFYYEGKNVIIHRFLCEKMYGPPPTKKHEAAHNCGNNRCVNPRHIRWATPKENQADRVIHGTHSRGICNGRAKLTEEEVLYIRSKKGKITCRKLADKFGLSSGQIVKVQNKDSWWLI